MRLEIPFFKQTTLLNCGPTVLRMILSYFGKNVSQDAIENKSGFTDKAVFSIQLALVAASYGFKVEFFTKHRFLNTDNAKLEFYQNYSDMDVEKAKSWMRSEETRLNSSHKSWNLV